MSASEELSAVLNRRCKINDALEAGETVKPRLKVFNPLTEFPEMTKRQIKDYENTFKKYDVGNDGFIDFEELKRMMEKLGAPQTHLGLKAMIKEVDEDHDGKISFREFLLIFHKANAGELADDSGLKQLASLTEIDVDAVGVGGAKEFFQAKIKEQSKLTRYEEEIRQEQEERRIEEEERRLRKQAFAEKANLFKAGAC